MTRWRVALNKQALFVRQVFDLQKRPTSAYDLRDVEKPAAESPGYASEHASDSVKPRGVVSGREQVTPPLDGRKG